MSTLPEHVSVRISYRPVSDTAVVTFDDESVTSFIERRGAGTQRVSLDYDTTVECTTLERDGAISSYLTGALIIGARSRHRIGLSHDSLPSDLRRHLLGLLGSSHLESLRSASDSTIQMGVSAVVPLSSLECHEQMSPCRPLHEVKSVVAALSDLASVLRSLPSTSWATMLGDETCDDLVLLSALVGELSTALDGARGMSTPAVASRIVGLIDQSSALPPSIVRAVRESVLRLCTVDEWSISARDLREATQAMKNLRP